MPRKQPSPPIPSKPARKAVESNPIRRFQANPGRTLAIHAMCASCMGCDENHMEPGFRANIRECTTVKCPLHNYRPFQTGDAE